MTEQILWESRKRQRCAIASPLECMDGIALLLLRDLLRYTVTSEQAGRMAASLAAGRDQLLLWQ